MSERGSSDYVTIKCVIKDVELTLRYNQRGDSGSDNMSTICIKAGAAATPNIHLHVPGA